ncbi:MAG: gamma-glutamyl-gamma-aminobutyrate hydrolase family protein, partial [Clostridia bacterium]|nr:gamma-glutamyl-gamma-aminobutyrate hydrolase family protein [Clostridia bacterium]
LLTDGPSIHVGSYGMIYNSATKFPELAREREIAEFYLVKRFIEEKKPVLGINRGMNLLNVALGGNLESYGESQDIKELGEGLSFSEDRAVFRHKSLKVLGMRCAPDNLDEGIFEEFIKGISI